jgi:hypothetical protein
MNAEDGKTSCPAVESQGSVVHTGSLDSVGGGGPARSKKADPNESAGRKAYSAPRLRSLGSVSAMTLLGGSGEGRKKPPG